MRLIDGDALCEGRVSNDPVVIAAKCAPSVDAEPVRHGEWVKMVFTDSGKFAGYKCSECGLVAKRKFSYCHCGAKMDGGKEE